MAQLKDALDSIGLEITSYDPKKKRPLKLSRGPDTAVDKFCEQLVRELKSTVSEFEGVSALVWDAAAMAEELSSLAEDLGVLKGKPKKTPKELEGLKLYCDVTYRGRGDRFFLVTPQNAKSVISGEYYISRKGLNDAEAMAESEGVIPEYRPRSGGGVESITQESGESVKVFNTYVPPRWQSHKWGTPDCLPPLFKKLVEHIFPIELEREYLYSWIYHSLFERSLVYLVLCGIPGLGKNRFMAVLTALHGYQNQVDGKLSTVREKFNSQLVGSTLITFDELEYTKDMENTLKAWQNTTVPIEKKGVDSSRGTPIYASIVISNNKPRDNYIAFDARKFAPLMLNTKPLLDGGLTQQEIDTLIAKTDERGDGYDPKFMAQIGRWIERHGRSTKWKNMEYQGPMFWRLAHISMFHWQKTVIEWLLDMSDTHLASVEQDSEKGFLWSSLNSRIMKRQKDKNLRIPDATSVSEFLLKFRSGKGKKVFAVEYVPDSRMNDFWVRVIFKTKVITEVPDEKAREGNKYGGLL